MTPARHRDEFVEIGCEFVQDDSSTARLFFGANAIQPGIVMMRIRPVDIDVQDSDPFQHDCLSRKEFASAISSIIKNTDGSAVLSIEGEWGSGKSTFLRMWTSSLKSGDKVQVITFNAWETDYAEDPLIAIIGELESQLEDRENKSVLIKKLQTHAGMLARRAVPALLKSLTYGMLDLNEHIERSAADVTEKFASDLINKYSEQQNALNDFRDALGGIANSEQKLVIVIDELDRCRPTYAVEMLERIKHLFTVDGIIFIIAMDRKQLGSSIKCLYGNEMNVDGYLRRFIDLSCRLPVVSISDFLNASFHAFGIDELIASRPRQRSEFGQPNDVKNILIKFFEANKLALRTQQQVLVRLMLVLASTPNRNAVFPIPTATLLFIKSLNEDVYLSFVTRKISVQELLQWMQSGNVQGFGDDSIFGHLGWQIEFWLRMIAHKRGHDGIDAFHDVRSKVENQGRKDQSSRYDTKEEWLLGQFESQSIYFEGEAFGYIQRKVELVDQIQIEDEPT